MISMRDMLFPSLLTVILGSLCLTGCGGKHGELLTDDVSSFSVVPIAYDEPYQIFRIDNADDLNAWVEWVDDKVEVPMIVSKVKSRSYPCWIILDKNVNSYVVVFSESELATLIKDIEDRSPKLHPTSLQRRRRIPKELVLMCTAMACGCLAFVLLSALML